jgi:hypothetical protein
MMIYCKRLVLVSPGFVQKECYKSLMDHSVVAPVVLPYFDYTDSRLLGSLHTHCLMVSVQLTSLMRPHMLAASLRE